MGVVAVPPQGDEPSDNLAMMCFFRTCRGDARKCGMSDVSHVKAICLRVLGQYEPSTGADQRQLLDSMCMKKSHILWLENFLH
jgi:hypothetical protein